MERIAKGYRLSTGREFSAHGGLVSIARSRNGEGFRVGEGYDGELAGATGDEDFDEGDRRPGERPRNWTSEEQRELADFMIAQWTAFKDALLQPCACGCGKLVEGGLMERAHPEDFREERG